MVKCGVFFAVRTEILKYYLYVLRLQRVNEEKRSVKSFLQLALSLEFDLC
jgi:hypothetical protein